MAAAGTLPASDGHLQDLANSIQSRFEGLSLPSDCCIFTVPVRLRRTNEEAYTPRIVAIGPYHHLNSSLMPMEVHKRLYLQDFLQYNQNYCLVDYIRSVKSWEDKARNCYDKQIDLDSDQFTEMMLLDGIFVIQLFLMYSGYWGELPNDQIFGRPWKLKDVRRDMVLLENQIPFFVVQQLFEMAFSTHHGYWQGLLLELMHNFFSLFTKMEELPQQMVGLEVKHFVDVMRHLFLPLESRALPSESRALPSEISHEHIKFSPSATDLVAAGVKLTKGGSQCLSDIKFENGELKIPCLVLYNRTESFFRNIIAFEQCYYRSHGNLISYMVFMDHLVDSTADTKLLIDKGIIENWLGNKEAATDLINAFCKEVSMLTDEYHFYFLSIELIEHCNKPHNKWKATFKRDYCSSPWVIISVIAAGTLLLLTVAQTLFSAFSLA